MSRRPDASHRLGLARRAVALTATLLCGCVDTLERGERLFRNGDRLGALEAWRSIPADDRAYAKTRKRIAVAEEEFVQLVTRYKQGARYFEERGRLAESILDYRLALQLRPADSETLEHVQQLARDLDSRAWLMMKTYRESFETGDLASARDVLEELRRIDAFDAQLETEERRLQEALRRELLIRLDAGRGRLAAGNHSAAQRAFHAVLELDPDNESAVGYLSYITTLRRENEASGEEVASFDLPLEGFATDAEIRAEGFYQNSLVAERGGDPYTAIRHDERALLANPAHEAARRHLDLLRVRLTDEVDPLIEEGRSAFRAEDLRTALDLWRRALLIDPGNERAGAYIHLAERYLSNLEQLRSDPSGLSDPERPPDGPSSLSAPPASQR